MISGCRKGGRDCVYPDPSTSKGSSRQKESSSASATTQSPTSSNSEDAELEDARPALMLDTIPDEDEDGVSRRRPPNKPVIQISDNKSYESNSLSPSPSTATIGDHPFFGNQPADFRAMLMSDPNLSNLPSDYQMHLQYLYDNVTCHHYGLTNDTDNIFVRGIIIEASRNKLLLNAVVAFAAYLRSTEQPEGKLRSFLLYYNRSITLLLDCLKQDQTHNLPTLLSILQLATIEVCPILMHLQVFQHVRQVFKLANMFQ